MILWLATPVVADDDASAKREAVESEFKARYPKLGRASSFSFRNTGSNASAAGRAAGDRVNFGRPLGGSSHAAIAAE